MNGKLNYIKRIIIKKMPYPLHLNLMGALVWLFGSVRLKVLYDCYRRPEYAYGVWEAASRAKALGMKGVTVIEFGVATGRGLMAMVIYAQKVSKELGIAINILGFDSGEGMPDFDDYRDHPELYTKGDFPMIFRDKLYSFLPSNAKLVLMDLIADDWTKTPLEYPIGFISIDVDYYSSTIAILNRMANLDSSNLMPNTVMYFDDVILDNHNLFQGEQLAITDFNNANPMRKIDAFAKVLRHKRMFKHAHWLENIYQLHVLDHYYRQNAYRTGDAPVTVITNKYFKQ